MKRSLGWLLIASFVVVGCSHAPAPSASRISIKHGLDPDAASIDLTPTDISIEDLLAMRMPDTARGDLSNYPNHRVGPFEKKTYRVKARIKSVQHKKDGDFYIVVEDDKGRQAVVEVPDPKLCKDSPLAAKISETRDKLTSKYHPTDDAKSVDDPAIIEGVGFLGWKGRPGSGVKGSTPRLMPGTGISFGS